ncbi:Poly(beta-D-mannuronate) C5 epimerase 7 [Leptolyngbya sp. O-77]|nr:Poly(beta-D-mannuronate) C5 epimerase 7 [Leptolyngbya sp. O-77]
MRQFRLDGQIAGVTGSDIMSLVFYSGLPDLDSLFGAASTDSSILDGSVISTSSSSAVAYVNANGAGGSSSSSATSPLGTSSSSDSVFVPGATSISAGASANTTPGKPPETTAVVTVPAAVPGEPLETIAVATVPASLNWADLDFADVAPLLPELVVAMGTGDWDYAQDGASVKKAVGNSEGNQLSGTSEQDWLGGKGGGDRLFGKWGNDVLQGGAGPDVLLGGLGMDVLLGGSGDDLLDGGGGINLLIGGRGADTFRLSGTAAKIKDSQPSIIADFNASESDKIQLLTGLLLRDLNLVPITFTDQSIRSATLITVGMGAETTLLAVVLNTVINDGSSHGVTTTLTSADFLAST